MKKFSKVISYIGALCIIFYSSILIAAEKNKPASPAPPSTNVITKTMVDKGVLSCAAQINSMTNFLGNNSELGAFLFTPPSAPDAHLVSSSLEILDKKGNIIYGSASFAPNQANGCGAVYDAVTWWPKKCNEIAKTQFPNKKITGTLKKNISVLDLGPSVRVFLMPAGPGCVSIKKEIVF